jgi:hypothetical protein
LRFRRFNRLFLSPSAIVIRKVKKEIKMRLATLIAAAALGFVFNATAAPLTFFGEDRGVFAQDGTPLAPFPNSTNARNAFLANLVGVGTETFESFAAGTSAPLPLVFPGAGTATLTGGGTVDNNPGTGQNAISGSQWWRTGPNNDFTINFDGPIAAFGFFGIDVGDIGAQLTLTLANGAPVVINIPHTTEPGGPTSGQNGSVIYFGYIDEANPFTSAAFTNVGAFGDDFGFDDMTIGSIQQVVRVPEPPVLLLLGVALLGLGFARRKA